MPAVLSMHDVRRRYGAGATEVVALDGVSLTVAAGEFVAIMGPSGSGKSTLLNMAGGLDHPTSGEVLVEGTDLALLDAAGLAAVRRRSIGFVFQEFNLVPQLTAEENVMLPMELDGTPVKAARQAAREVLAAVGLDGMWRRFPDDLSGGEQQRVAIARAMTGDRRLILADEPTGALDTTTGEAVAELIAGYAADGGAVVLVTHEPRIASFADRIVWLRDGRVVDEVDARHGARVTR